MSSSVKGLGISTAHGLVERHRNLNKVVVIHDQAKNHVPTCWLYSCAFLHGIRVFVAPEETP